mmetsp:Transcript_100214/g.150252  ORF Transcript_100214/g.150252 Transcript_100214/m.150252 type:complete len:208 (-) Transcript_100214:2079-2702(-)
MHACSSVSSIAMNHVVTRFGSTLSAIATKMPEFTLNSRFSCDSPSPYGLSALSARIAPPRCRSAPACTSRRRAGAFSAAHCSLSLMRPTRMMRWESEKVSRSPVCCGAHSYPGLIHHARIERPLSEYRCAITCEKLPPSANAYSLEPRIVCMNLLASVESSSFCGSSIAVGSLSPNCGNKRPSTSRRTMHDVGNGSSRLGRPGRNEQ